MSTPHILVTDWFAPDFAIEEAKFNALGWKWSRPSWTPPAPPKPEQEADILARIKSTPNIVGALFILAPVTAQVINALPDSCTHLQRIGIGLDNIDLDAAKARGITVDNTPDYAIEEVAVHAMGMVLSLHRQLGATQNLLAKGEWRIQPPLPIDRLSTLTVGLIGLGRIGRKFAELVQPFVKRVIFHDPFATNPPAGVESASLDEVYAASDFVSLHCPLLPSTRDIINRESLRKMKPTAYLINVSRGALVDAAALDEALGEGIIAGAGLDVFDPEILPKESPLHRHANIILTSHTAWYSRHSVIDCRSQAVDKLIAKVQSKIGA